MSDIVDLMNPEAIARLRHSLRTPLNHLIGYAEMIREEAKSQGARAEKSLMDQVLSIARQVVDRVQQALPTKSHITDDALPELRTVMLPAVERVEQILKEFSDQTGRAFAKELGKMQSATRDLLAFARGVEAPAAGAATSATSPISAIRARM